MWHHIILSYHSIYKCHHILLTEEILYYLTCMKPCKQRNVYHPYQLVQGFFHQQYHHISSHIAHTVDGRNPAPVEVGSLSHYLQGFFYIPGGWPWDFFHHHISFVQPIPLHDGHRRSDTYGHLMEPLQHSVRSLGPTNKCWSGRQTCFGMVTWKFHK